MRMASNHVGSSEAAVLPLLVGKQSCNITFVLDTSESSRAVLSSVKRLLVQTLLTKASLGDSRFNIITFSDKVHRWSHHMLPCAPNTVYTALSWIHSIRCSAGRDLLAALTLALTDPACHAVHLLLTDLLTHPEEEAVRKGLATLAAQRPVNTFYLQDWSGQLDHSTSAHLQQLTRATRGSCYLIVQDANRELGKVIPLCTDIQSSVTMVDPVHCLCPSSSESPHLRCSTELRSSLENPAHLLTSCFLSDPTRVYPHVSPGCPVLARRDLDGFYYRGTVIQHVQGLAGVWLVEFEGWAAAGVDSVPPQRQLVCSLDMVNLHTGHRTLPLAPGDAVLSPWEPNLRRYGPGRVTAVTGHRGAFTMIGVNLRVQMWHGCVTLLPDHLVLPISNAHYQRMVCELRVPTSAQCRWLCGGGSYCSASPLPCCPLADHQLCPVPPRGGSGPGATGGSEWREKRLVKDTEEERSDSESSSPPLSDDESLAMFLPVARLRRSQQGRPPWRYWRRSGSEPQHRQPGISFPRGISQPDESRLPVPLTSSSSPNHSSLFLSLPAAKSRGVHIRDIFDAKVRPQPPGNSRNVMVQISKLNQSQLT